MGRRKNPGQNTENADTPKLAKTKNQSVEVRFMAETMSSKTDDTSGSPEVEDKAPPEPKVEDVEPQETEESKESSQPVMAEEEGEEEAVEEKIYTIPLGKAWIHARHERSPKSIKLIRQYVLRHMKPEEVKIHDSLNRYVWTRSIEKPPRRVRVRVTLDKEGTARVYLFKGQL